MAVLAGAGPIFCAGADLAWMQRMRDYSREDNLRDADAAAGLFGALDALPVPVVGRVQGAALGGGAGLVAVCDVVVAADDAIFGFTEVRLGILPAVIGPFVVAEDRRVRRARALPDRRPLPGLAGARAIGLVHEVVPAEELDAVVVWSSATCTGAPSRSAASRRCCSRSSTSRSAEVRDSPPPRSPLSACRPTARTVSRLPGQAPRETGSWSRERDAGRLRPHPGRARLRP